MGQEAFKREEYEEEDAERDEEEKYHFGEIEELEKPLVLVLEKLKANIEAGVYDVLLSDDKGGRIPTLAMREIINREYEKAERKRVEVYFLSGGHMLTLERGMDSVLKEHIEKKIKNEIHRRALVVTEFVQSGTSVKVLTDMLKEAGVTAFDVVALVSDKESVELGEGRNFFSGITPENAEENRWRVNESGVFPPELYYSSNLSGVVKKTGMPHPELHKLLKTSLRRHLVGQGIAKKKREARQEVNDARKDVKTLAENAEKALGW